MQSQRRLQKIEQRRLTLHQIQRLEQPLLLRGTRDPIMLLMRELLHLRRRRVPRPAKLVEHLRRAHLRRALRQVEQRHGRRTSRLSRSPLQQLIRWRWRHPHGGPKAPERDRSHIRRLGGPGRESRAPILPGKRVGGQSATTNGKASTSGVSERQQPQKLRSVSKLQQLPGIAGTTPACLETRPRQP